MILSDIDIKKELEGEKISIKPLFPDAIQPSSVDLHLGKHFLVYERNNHSHIDPKNSVEEDMKRIEVPVGEYFVLHSGEFALGVTWEEIWVGNYKGKLDGLSSVGRLAAAVHITASTINPNDRLYITLELLNVGHSPIYLYPGMPIAQIEFAEMRSLPQNVYGAEGLGNVYTNLDPRPQPSNYWKKFQGTKYNWMDFAKKMDGEG